jgi:ABC-type nitrate/sulfonate/bicarbonate transport system ATPase subunit
VLAGKLAEMAHRKRFPGADPSNLWGNAREGSDVATELGSRAQPSVTTETRHGAERRPCGERPHEHAIDLRDVTRTFTDRRGARVQALAGVSLSAARGELLAVVGPSGCGKTTLLELICGLQEPQAGSLECDPAVLMPQHDLLLPWLSAIDNAALALRIAHLPRAEARTRAAELFAELGLAGFERAQPGELSGGMRQRVAFVRTLLSGKPLLCLDEPFGALDALTRAEMQEWLARALAHEPRTVVLVTHDVEEAVLLADRVVVLSPRPGRVVEQFEVRVRRPRGRTDTAVVALRERALGALALGSSAASA